MYKALTLATRRLYGSMRSRAVASSASITRINQIGNGRGEGTTLCPLSNHLMPRSFFVTFFILY